jgi:cell division protein ZipA
VSEIIILIIVILIAFAAASWYAHHKSQQRASEFERELDLHNDEDEEFKERFDALFEQELHEQSPSSTSSFSETESSEIDIDLFDEPLALTEEDNVVSEPLSQTEQQEKPAKKAKPEPAPAQDWDMVIAFTIMAESSTMFSGKAVKAALEAQDLHFGDMQIYHRFTQGSRKQSLFSVANIIDPGTLLPDKFVSMSTPGLLIFARLPAPVNGLALFDDLLDTARNMTQSLGGILCDETRQPVSEDAVEAMRTKIFEYQMSVQAESDHLSNDYFN